MLERAVLFGQFPDYRLISEAAAAAFAIARLLHFRMLRKFPALISYLFAIAIRATILSLQDDKTHAYVVTYLIASPTVYCVAAFAVYEVFALIFLNYPGLRTAGRWAVYTALAIAVSATLLLLRKPWPGTPYDRLIFYELVFERSITFGLAVIIIILMISLSRYPLHLGRNTYVASGFFSAMFLAQAVVRLIDTLSPANRARFADYPEVAFTALCLVGWGIMLRPADAPEPARPPTDERREAELLHQLESLNSILSRASRW
jgi:hypothetical protein